MKDSYLVVCQECRVELRGLTALELLCFVGEHREHSHCTMVFQQDLYFALVEQVLSEAHAVVAA